MSAALSPWLLSLCSAGYSSRGLGDSQVKGFRGVLVGGGFRESPLELQSPGPTELIVSPEPSGEDGCPGRQPS